MGKLTINEAWCKGCAICSEFCPKDVLEVKNGKVTVIDEGACISCKMCEYRCPDFAIVANKEGK